MDQTVVSGTSSWQSIYDMKSESEIAASKCLAESVTNMHLARLFNTMSSMEPTV